MAAAARLRLCITSLCGAQRTALGIAQKVAKLNRMTATETASMIRREVGSDGVCLLTFDRPNSGANIFDAATIDSLREHLDAIENDSSVKGVIVTSGKKSIFIAGADLQTLLRQAQTGELRAFIAEGQKQFNRLAALKVPTVAAIHGACAGGGYEITLTCDYRIASSDPATRIGLPETTLGLLPAWGGATRLPRLLGLEAASEVILKGKLHAADEALKIGLVDEVVAPDQLLEAARRKLAQGKREVPPPPNIEVQVPLPRESANPAPRRAIDVMMRGLQGSIDDGLALEVDGIVELGETEATQNLIRNFFLGDKFRKGSSKTKHEKVTRAAVIGAGVMGSGIAQWLSSRGVGVILRDVSSEMLDRGLSNIEKTYGDAVKRGLMSDSKAQEGRARIVASTDPGQMRDVEIVVEAASEKLEIKKGIFADLAAKTPDTAILATNTSALSITDLGATTGQAARVVGLHFFNPVSRMKLVEVVVGKETAPETIERALAFTRQVAKLPVLVQDSPGFLVNRVLFPYLLDAAEMFELGADAEQIDQALLAWGMPMGPLRLIDEIGVDITVDIADTLEKAYGRRNHAAAVLHWLRDGKMLGRKTGSGFYKYEGKSQTPNEALVQWRSALHGDVEGPETKPLLPQTSDDIANRLVFLMVNEAARCLEEKVVASAEDADFGMMMGTGFPGHRGGPLRFADYYGAQKLVAEMDTLHRLAGEGDKFVPASLLRRHGEHGTKFYEG
jgi:3-hydroxyacyl-CoA dehydrogenase/enoyl-CoA hydratase/3-hydroxybutyryl-CoA epimerase